MNIALPPLIGLALVASSAGALANAGHQFLQSLSDSARNQRFTEMLVQMPGNCVVERNFFRGFDAERAAFWSAGCKNKEAYALKILDDGKGGSRIMDCRVLMARAKDDCFAKM